MKGSRILLALVVVTSFTTTNLFGQGRINFNNSSATPIRFYDGTVLGTASTARYGFGPASVQVRLCIGISSYTFAPILIGTQANQSFVLNTASTIAAGQGTFAGGNPLPIPGFFGGDQVFLKFTAVSINGMYYGESSIIKVTLTGSPSPPTAVFSTTADASHWDGLTFSPWIPEPTSGALLALGAAVWLASRLHRRTS